MERNQAAGPGSPGRARGRHPGRDRIICGDAAAVLSRWSEASIDCVITSPPYYGQRDYEDLRQVGIEDSPEAYVAHVAAIFEEVRRVLKHEGTLWLNLGDKYVNGSLLGLPWRVALGLAERGWVLRADVIWHKPNAMPSSVKNRPTIDHEYVFLFTKTQRGYYYDADAVREPHVTFSDKSRMRGGRNHFGRKGGTPEQGKNQGNSNLHDARWDQAFHPGGRNRRTVWEIPLSKCREAHFAVFPEQLVELCLAAGCPPGGVVLDPFVGSGTVAVVARRTGRSFLGVDCNQTYCSLARRRVSAVEPDRPAG